MADMFHSILTEVLDRLIPVRQFVRRPRPSDPWFDCECRHAKRLTRRLRRAHTTVVRAIATIAASGTSTAAAAAAASRAEAAWSMQRRRYCELRDQKRSAYWFDRIDAGRGSPKRLWKSIDSLLRRGRQPSSAAIDVEDFGRFFKDKVDAVRLLTENSPDPVF